MASAVNNTRTVTTVEMVLTLSTEEASFLRDVFHRIGGSPGTSPRKYAISIDDALRHAGVERTNADISGSIYFKS